MIDSRAALSRPTVRRILVACCIGLAVAAEVRAEDEARRPFTLEIEGGPVWFSRNDVRIPGDDGTRFTMLDLTGRGPDPYARLTAAWDIDRRHGLRLVFAPLEVSGTGTFDRDVDFAGTTFDADRPVRGTYKFNTYRLTYRYTWLDREKWNSRIGVTGLVRDAKIKLEQGGKSASDSDLGFVPLLHLYGEYRMTDRFRFILDFDGLVGPQGRAIDLALKANYDLSDHWTVGILYRTIEGGADNDDVYNFAWTHFFGLAVGLRF